MLSHLSGEGKLESRYVIRKWRRGSERWTVEVCSRRKVSRFFLGRGGIYIFILIFNFVLLFGLCYEEVLLTSGGLKLG